MNKTPDYPRQINILHKVSVVVFVVLAVVAGLFMNSASVQFRLTHLTRDVLASQSQTVLTPASHLLIDLSLKVAVIVVLGLAALTSLLALTWLRRRNEAWQKNAVSPLTWIMLGGVVPALMVETVALLSGVQDVMVLKMMAGATLLSGVLACLAQVGKLKARTPKWTNWILAIFVGLLPWLVILTSAILTPIYGEVRMPWYTYAEYVVVALASVAALLNLARELRRQGAWKNYAYSERNYLLINLFAKSLFAIVLIVGLHR